MNFDPWKEIKKLIPYTKEKRKILYTPMMKEELEHVEIESSNHPTNSNTQQLSGDPVAAEQPSTLKELASIEDDSIGNLSSSNNENYILSVLNDLPEQWIGKEMNLRAITTKKDAIWIINRVLQDVERGLINAQFKVEEFNHLCDITLTLKIATGLTSFPSAITAFNPVFSFILSDIKSETISRTKRKFSNGSYQ